MGKRIVHAIYGTVEVEDSNGIRLTIDDEKRVSVPLTPAAAKQIGEALMAFAIVNFVD